MKGTTRKINIRERGWVNDLDPLMKVGLALVKHVLTLLAKSVLVPLGLTIAASRKDGAIKKKFFWARDDYNDSIKGRDEWYDENS